MPVSLRTLPCTSPCVAGAHPVQPVASPSRSSWLAASTHCPAALCLPGCPAQVPILSNLSEQQLFQLAGCMSNREFASGQEVFRKGEEGDTFYIVEEGFFRWGWVLATVVGWVLGGVLTPFHGCSRLPLVCLYNVLGQEVVARNLSTWLQRAFSGGWEAGESQRELAARLGGASHTLATCCQLSPTCPPILQCGGRQQPRAGQVRQGPVLWRAGPTGEQAAVSAGRCEHGMIGDCVTRSASATGTPQSWGSLKPRRQQPGINGCLLRSGPSPPCSAATVRATTPAKVLCCTRADFDRHLGSLAEIRNMWRFEALRKVRLILARVPQFLPSCSEATQLGFRPCVLPALMLHGLCLLPTFAAASCSHGPL